MNGMYLHRAMSQEFNDYGITNSISRAWPTDMLTIYNQPVWDITLIAKPFYWGYLLLGPGIWAFLVLGGQNDRAVPCHL